MEIVGLITGFFKFFDQVVWFIQTLQKTPQEHHEELLKKIQEEADKFEQTGRPTWD